MSQPEIHQIGEAELRIFQPAPDTDDRSPMFVLEVLGVSVLLRMRADEEQDVLSIRINNESREPTVMCLSVNEGSEDDYTI